MNAILVSIWPPSEALHDLGAFQDGVELNNKDLLRALTGLMARPGWVG